MASNITTATTARSTTLWTRDPRLLPSPTLTNPELILPYRSRDDICTRTPSPPPLESMRLARGVNRSASVGTFDLGHRPPGDTKSKLGPALTGIRRMAPSSSDGRVGQTEVTSHPTQLRPMPPGSKSRVGTDKDEGMHITRLGSPPSQDNILAPQRSDRLIISAFDGDDDEEDEEDNNEYDQEDDDVESNYDLGGSFEGADGKRMSVNKRRLSALTKTKDEEQSLEENDRLETVETVPLDPQTTTHEEGRMEETGGEEEDPLSSAALSAQAEQILANAKKRLDVSGCRRS